MKDARRLGFKEWLFFLCSGHVPYHIWSDSLNVTEEEPVKGIAVKAYIKKTLTEEVHQANVIIKNLQGNYEINNG